MPFLTKADFNTHIYAEVVESITRGDDSIVTEGISAGIGEAKSYLSKYDLLPIFGDTIANPTLSAEIIAYLKVIVKDLACWQMIRLSNPNIDLKLFRTNYEDAITWLTKVQKGQVDPPGFPYPADDPLTVGNENSGVKWSSNPKRKQTF